MPGTSANTSMSQGETLNIDEDVTADIDNVVVEGTIVVPDGNDGTTIDSYIGAKYGIDTAGENNQTVTTTYYTTLAAAMGQIENVNDEGVTANVYDLDINVTVADGQLLTFNVLGTVSQNTVLTV